MRLSRDDAIKFRLSGLERQLLDAIVDGEGQNVSEVIRWLIREEARRRGVLASISEAWQTGGEGAK